MHNNFYVYVLFRPNGRPCYVGKGQGSRDRHHFESTRKVNGYLRTIIKNAGGSIPCVRVQEDLSEQAALETEIALIAAIGRRKHGGPLVNLTDGGEGTSGWIQPQHVRDAVAAANAKRVISEATRKKLAEASRGRKHSPEVLLKMSEAQRGRPPTRPETRMKLSARIWSEETRKRMSASAKRKRPTTDETRAKMRESAKKRLPPSEETRKKLRLAQVRIRLSKETCSKNNLQLKLF